MTGLNTDSRGSRREEHVGNRIISHGRPPYEPGEIIPNLAKLIQENSCTRTSDFSNML
jgi:hypothetical protein